MTIGPAPMIRIEEMSVRLGIQARRYEAQKKGALLRVLGLGADEARRARGCLDQNRGGREGALRPAPLLEPVKSA